MAVTMLCLLSIAPVPADDTPESEGTESLAASQYLQQLAAVRGGLGIPKNWTRRSTYDSQVTVGSAVRAGNVVSRDRNSAPAPMKYVLFEPAVFSGSAVLWIDGAGTARFCESGRSSENVMPVTIVNQLLEAGFAVICVDLPSAVRQSGSKSDSGAAVASLMAIRVRATLAAAAAVMPHVSKLHVVGTGEAGPATLMAAAFFGDFSNAERQRIVEVIGDVHSVMSDQKPDPPVHSEFPEAEPFGGLVGIVGLTRSVKLTIAGTQKIPAAELKLLQDSLSQSATPAEAKLLPELLTDEMILDLVIPKSR